MASFKTYTAYLRGNSSREFVEAMDNLRKQLHLETGNKLRHLYSDAFSTYMDQTSVADWRDVHSIQFNSNPGYAKQWNAYAEGYIRRLKRPCRSNLDKLVGLEVMGKTRHLRRTTRVDVSFKNLTAASSPASSRAKAPRVQILV